MNEILQAILLFIGFAAVLFAAYAITKFLGSKMSYSKGSRYIKIIDRVFLSNDKSICIIQVGNRHFIVGATNQGIALISEIAEADIMPLSSNENKPFNNLFEKYITRVHTKENDYAEEQDRLKEIMKDLERRKKM